MSNGTMSMEAHKKAIGELLWLHYYNQVLFEKGVISENERNKMSNRINSGNGARNERKRRRVLT